MSTREKRRIRPVFVTDRVASPDHERREWKAAEDLICWQVPAGFDDISYPVLILVDNPRHLMALLSHGVALAHMAAAMPDDLTPGRTDHRARMAWAAQSKAGEARRVILDTWNKGILPNGVATQALESLDRPLGYAEPFSQSFVISALMYGPMAINSLRHLETPIQVALFGSDSRSPDLIAQDRKRAREFYGHIVHRTAPVTEDQPMGQLTIPLTQKLLQTVLPQLLPDHEIPKSFDISDLEIVTRPGRRVSAKSQDSQNGHSAERPAIAIPGAAFPS